MALLEDASLAGMRWSLRNWVGRMLAQRVVPWALLLALGAGALLTACGPLGPTAQQCPRHQYGLSASTPTSLIAVIPRDSGASAQWGLRELASLLPLVAQPGLQLHVLYTQDADDLAPAGGDGGPPQVLATSAPSVLAFRVPRAPAEPEDPTSLSAKLYCQRLAAWRARATAAVRAAGVRRTEQAVAWARKTAARVTALAGRPIPDTSGAEAGGEVDTSASTFAAAEVAEGSPQPTIVFFGGLSVLQPPALRFRVPARLIALIRSVDPALVLRSERAWARWAEQDGGTFEAFSANDDASSIALAIDGGEGSACAPSGTKVPAA